MIAAGPSGTVPAAGADGGGRAHPIDLLFNEWWRDAPPEVVEAYVGALTSDPHLAELVRGEQWTPHGDFDELGHLAPGSFGRTYHDWILAHDLDPWMADTYQRLHDDLVVDGKMGDVPAPIRHAMVRLYQTHDFQHVVTGYGACLQGEMAMFAFGLAQIRFPYFSMWMATITEVGFVQPALIPAIMDAITDGWRLGRSVASIQAERWEQMLAEPLDEVRARYGVTPTPLARSLATCPG